MKRYNLINNILGWIVFAIASSVYIITSEPTMSLWDCGEYIATAYKLEVGHPPGAPLFQMLGRFFTLFAFGDVTLVARMINTMSALASGFTILFLFWSITMIAKKIIGKGKELAQDQILLIMFAGITGALAYTFSDSFWFSAVEGEVYALSSFFTAIVFWAILKWDEHADEPHAYRWLILIAYLMGLSIGVHLLNLLAIPAITFVYYFRKFPGKGFKGAIVTAVISILILASIMYVIIPWIIKLAGWFELFFINTVGLPFNSGTLLYFILLIGLIAWGILYTRKAMKPVLNAVILAFTFIVIGYSSFLMLVIRSNANPPIDENNPENAMYLLAYLNREQYGDWPLWKGQYYNAPVVDRKNGTPVYTRDDKTGKYVITDKREMVVPVFDPRFTTIFPRMWDQSEPRFEEEYIRWGNVKGRPVQVQSPDGTETLNVPTFAENLAFFWNYQLVHMYYRYFMWNFAGRQNDFQGLGGKTDGNWKSGIPVLDKMRLGSQDIPEGRQSRADNSLYLLPLLLGILGIVFTLRKNKEYAWIIFLLFFMTGLAIVLYLNQHSPQPRERDYAYAGSFYAFAIWIGLGIPQLAEWLRKPLGNKLSGFAALAFGLVVVGVMAQQEWDDHDRSGRYAARAIACNYLNSCEKDAILFTNGDNDTFPLWYAQEVEGIRTDVRVVNLSLLNTDWYIDMMKRKVYDSDPVPFSLTRDKYLQGNRDVTYIMEDEKFRNSFTDLKSLFEIIARNDQNLKRKTSQYGVIDFFPTASFMVPFDSAEIARSGLVPASMMHRLDTLFFTFPGRAIEKANLMILDLLANNNWRRPVYFVSTTGPGTYIGLEGYFHQEGMAYRLLPVKANAETDQTGEVHTDALYRNVMERFIWGNMNDPDVYCDESIKRMATNSRDIFGRLVTALLKEGKTDSAKKVLDRCLEVLPEHLLPHDYFSIPLGIGYLRVGEEQRGMEIVNAIRKNSREELTYFFSFRGKDLTDIAQNVQKSLFTLHHLSDRLHKAGFAQQGVDVEKDMESWHDLYMQTLYDPQRR